MDYIKVMMQTQLDPCIVDSFMHQFCIVFSSSTNVWTLHNDDPPKQVVGTHLQKRLLVLFPTLEKEEMSEFISSYIQTTGT